MDLDLVQSLVEPLGSLMLVVLLCAAAMLAAPGTALGAHHHHHRHHGPTAKQTIDAAVNTHNTFGDRLAGFDSDSSSIVKSAQSLCESAASSDDPQTVWSILDQMVAVDFPPAILAGQDYNKTTVARWPTYFKRYRATLRRKKQRQKFDKAIANLKDANNDHSTEFFHLQGVYAALQSHNCAQADSEDTAARSAGVTAWVEEYVALGWLQGLFDPHSRATVKYLLSPYNAGT